MKNRIQAIVKRRIGKKLSHAQKLCLTMAFFAAIFVPTLVGLLNAPLSRAQSHTEPPAESASGWMLVPAMMSQTADAPEPPAFEVASVRLNPGPWHEMLGFSSSGPNLRLIAWSAKSLIMEAYNLMGHEVVYPSTGASDPDRYDIAAKAEGDVPRTRPEFRRMLQFLLADRFQLRFHREMRELAVYYLVVGKNGPAFRETPPGTTRRANHGVDGRKQTLDLSLATMESLAAEMRSYYSVDRPVLDKTGLTGLYDIQFAATPEFRLRDSSEPGDVDIFNALQSQLGLKLESGKANVEVLVVDQIEKPSAN